MAARVRILATPLALALAFAAAARATAAPLPPSQEPAAHQPPAEGTAIEALVVDRDGRFVEGLGPSDFKVTVDGRSRAVLWVRRVSRGPGASTDAASRQVGAEGTALYAAEPRRNVIIVVDQSTLVRGDERAVVRAADAFLDRLGIDDLIAVVRVPTPAGSLLTLTTERPPIREALSRVAGLDAAARVGVDAPPLPDPAAMGEPNTDPNVDRVPDLNKPPERPVRAGVSEMPQDATEEDLAYARNGLSALQALMVSLQGLPGRKVVLLFSAGLLAPSQVRVEETAAAAAAARVTVYAYGLQGGRDAFGRTPDLGHIQNIAQATGGSFTMLGRNPERAVARSVAELSACYVLGVEAEPSDTDGNRHALRVETNRKGLTARSGAWLPSARAPEDLVPVPPAPAAPAAPAGAPPPTVTTRPGPAPGAAARGTRPSPSARREAELKLALARLFEYADAYERQYSMLVAEEEYTQLFARQHKVTRADLMLVKPAERWVSFRDVFAVDGRPLRDREERLRRLFLDPTPEGQSRLQSVMDESAKHNIGPVVRSINVPLFPLDILRSPNRARFDFELGWDAEADGLPAWRVEYTETARPTMVEGLEGEDVPIRGRFLVDRLTGAIIETTVEISKGPVDGEIVVRYGRDAALGLWVPAQMRERYLQGRRILMEGRADYSRFRRFQVKTEETVTLPVR